MKNLLGIVLTGVLLAMGFGWLSACTEAPQPATHIPQDQIVNVRLLDSRVQLPPSAADVWVVGRSHLDAYQMLRFDASLGDARAFAREALGRDPVPGENPAFTGFGQDYDWWLREYPQGAEGGSNFSDQRIVEIVLLPMGNRARVWTLVSAD